jgi:hypothetical protein
MLKNFAIPTEMRRMSHAQTSNVGDRIAKELLDPKTGVPASDPVLHSLAQDIAAETLHFDLRVRLDRTNVFTQRKAKFEKERDDYLKAIRRGLQTILREPEKTVLPARRAAAMRLQELLERRPKNFERLGAGENSTHLKYLFEDWDTEASRGDLQETDLLRFYTLLKEADAAFGEVVREQGEAEAAEAELPATQNPKKLPQLQAIKQTLITRLTLAMENLDYLASKGRQPYVALAERCALIFTEAGFIAQSRETRQAKKGTKAELTS